MGVVISPLQIADFGMCRALQDTDYFVSCGGKIPELQRLSTTRNTPLPVICGALVMYEVWTLGIKPYHQLIRIEV